MSTYHTTLVIVGLLSPLLLFYLSRFLLSKDKIVCFANTAHKKRPSVTYAN